ncbi:MAG TPA: HNH endonuclease signature motif containing protein [Alphaproteobacteria bacterium]|nr:HNH endonuclease signature motif containing protein [Alphaproteobacteria bacterium]
MAYLNPVFSDHSADAGRWATGMFDPDALEESFNTERVLNLITLRRIPFALLNVEETAACRQGYNKRLRLEFRNAAYEECYGVFGVSRAHFATLTKGYQTHHKLPSNMGGGNEPDNLNLVHPRIHSGIHRRIHLVVREILKIHRVYERSKKPKISTREEALGQIKNVHIDRHGKIWIDIPWPEGKVCVPRLLIHTDNPANGPTDKWPRPLPANDPNPKWRYG